LASFLSHKVFASFQVLSTAWVSLGIFFVELRPSHILPGRRRGKVQSDCGSQGRRGHEQAITQLQTESEGLISGLEAAVSDLKDEKERLELGLAADLESTSTKLEDTEDTLYDVQQSSKKAQKDASVTLWRRVISQQRMKTRFDSHIDDMEKCGEIFYGELLRLLEFEIHQVSLRIVILY
jgi:hypothetical protein